MISEKIKKKFPVGFPVGFLPEGAKEEALNVFRICRSGKVDYRSFLPSYLDEFRKVKELQCANEHGDGELDIGEYSLSTFENRKHAESKLKFFKNLQPEAILAFGTTDPSCGIVQRTKERKKSAKSHVDWWLFEGAQPHIFFKEVDEDI